MKNYYEILEVDTKASKEMVERAFKLLAKRYHPDTKQEEEKASAEEKFKEINTAYEILSDGEKRKAYDIELAYAKDSEIESLVNERDTLKQLVAVLRQELRMTQTQMEQNYSINEQQIPYTNYHTVSPEETMEQVTYTYAPVQKHHAKDLLSFVLAIATILLLGFVLWKIPFTHQFLVQLYENNPPIKNIADFIIHLFQK